jgi:hypothetical protein
MLREPPPDPLGTLDAFKRFSAAVIEFLNSHGKEPSTLSMLPARLCFRQHLCSLTFLKKALYCYEPRNSKNEVTCSWTAGDMLALGRVSDLFLHHG